MAMVKEGPSIKLEPFFIAGVVTPFRMLSQ
jgi:hypothetical protein